MAGDGVTPYQSGGAGGKFQKRPIRKSAKGTPYDRPSTAIRNNNNNNNNPSIFSKLANPASRLLYAGADRLFGVFRKRLPSIPAQRLQETIEEPRNGIHEAGQNSGSKNATEVSEPSTDGEINLASISAATDISEIENVFKQKTFTRSEIERLKALLNSKTTESDVGEGDKAKFLSTTSHAVRLEASTSGTLNKHEEERENFHAAISTPIINTRVFDEDVASPAELAKAYMVSRPAKVSPLPLRQDSAVLNNTTTLLRTPIQSPAPRTAYSFNGYENHLTTPRSRGRSALYNMAHPPYYRGTSAFSQKVIKSDYDHNVASLSPAWEREGTNGSSKMAGKRSNSELDDISSGGPIRRIRQKSNLLTQVSKPRSERLLLRNEPEVKENGETSNHNLVYASVPTQSTEMASKIFQQLERMSPKEKPTVSRLAVTTEKLVTRTLSNMVDKLDADVSISQSNDKVEENGQKMFAVPRNAFSSMNGISTVPVEPPQKKRAFQMSANEESVELDEDNHSNGHVSISLGENKKPEISVFANKDVSADAPAEVSKKFTNSSPSTSYTQSPNSMVDTVELQKEPTVFAKSGTSTKSAEKVSPFMSSANEPFGVKPNVSPNAKPLGSTSLFNAGTKNSQIQFPAFNKVDNGNTQKSVSTFGTSKPVSSASPTTTTSASDIFSFGGSIKNSSITNGTPASSPFSFGLSAITSSTSAEPKSNNISSSPFASSTLFSSSAAATSATNNHSQGSGTGFKAANTQTPSAVIHAASFSFGLSSTTSNVFGSGFSSASSFGPSSTSGPTASIFGSTQSSAFGSSSTPFPFGASFTSMPSTTTSSPIVFGSSQGQSVFGAPPNNNSDQICMETNQTPSPSIQASAGKPSFEFDSTSPTPSTINPFQFASQTSETPSTNPFQEASGSFSLGSGGGGGGGGDKSGRRIFKAKRRK